MRLLIVLTLSAISIPALADVTMPRQRPRWAAPCAERLRDAQRALLRRFPSLHAGMVSGDGDRVDFRSDGDGTADLSAWVAVTDQADRGWDGETFAWTDDDSSAHPEDCPPDGPQFHEDRVRGGRIGVVQTDGAPPDVLRVFRRLFHHAIDGCLDE